MIADILDKAADLIEPEGAWTTDAEARNADGDEGEYDMEDAVCFCAGGAIWRCSPSLAAASLAGNYLAEMVGEVPAWNDDSRRTQPEVVAKLREVAAKAREQRL